MDLAGIIAHLKANVALLEGRVAGVAEFTAAMSGELRPEAYPAAYVVPLGESASENDQSNALYQTVTETVGVVVAFDNTGDRRGQSVTQLYRVVRAGLFAALLNWRGTDPEHALRGFELGSGALLQQDRARLFYQWAFTLEVVFTDADGWQLDEPPLLEIDANSQPGDPSPAFRTTLPPASWRSRAATLRGPRAMPKDGFIYVKPAEGRLVRDYRTTLPVPDEGAFVPLGDPHFMASLDFGDLVVAQLRQDVEADAPPDAEADAPPGAEPVDDHAAAPAPSQAE